MANSPLYLIILLQSFVLYQYSLELGRYKAVVDSLGVKLLALELQTKNLENVSLIVQEKKKSYSYYDYNFLIPYVKYLLLALLLTYGGYLCYYKLMYLVKFFGLKITIPLIYDHLNTVVLGFDQYGNQIGYIIDQKGLVIITIRKAGEIMFTSIDVGSLLRLVEFSSRVNSFISPDTPLISNADTALEVIQVGSTVIKTGSALFF
jgi:hypothetical protein